MRKQLRLNRVLIGFLLLASTTTAQQIRLTWDGAPQTAPCLLTGYNVYRSQQAGVYSAPLNANKLTETSYTDTTAQLNQTYFYVVKATASGCNGTESGPSNEITAIARPNLSPLPAPTNLRLTCSADGTLATAAWDAVPNATDYWTRAWDQGVGKMIHYQDGGNSLPSISFTVTPGQQAEFWVHPFNASYPAANSDWGAGVGWLAAAFTTCNALPTPKPPTQLRVVQITQPTTASIRFNKAIDLKATVNLASTLAFRVNGQTVCERANVKNISCKWNPKAFRGGSVSLAAVAVDENRVETLVTRTVRVD